MLKEVITAVATALLFSATAFISYGETASGSAFVVAAEAADVTDISDFNVTIPYGSYTYSGLEITPTVTIKDDLGSKLTEGSDFTVSYSNNINAGTATITVTGKGRFRGTKEKQFTIKPNDLSDNHATLPYINYTYSGKAITPEPTIKVSGMKLIKGTDYTVSYSNNINVGNLTARVTIKGKGNFTGTTTGYFNINPNDLSDNRATIPYLNYTYTGKARTPEPTLKVGGVKLVKGKDYTVSYSNNINVGNLTAKVTIKGKGNFTGTTTRYFNINPNDLSDNRATIPSLNYAYTGHAITPEPTLKVGGMKLVKGKDYTVSYSNNIVIGNLSAKVTIMGKGNFSGTTVRYFNIKPNNISDNRATIPFLNYFYMGRSVTPTPTLKINGVTLVNGRDYVVSYKNNSGIGTATVMLTGKGNYTGTTYREFGIVKAHGFFKIDGHTHYFDINGREARNCWAQGYQFDSSGAMTAESEAFKAKIDKYAADMLAKYGYDSNTPYSKLKTLFYHFEKSGYNFQEQSFPNFSSPKWEMDAANYLLTYRRGNCHRYSALMAYLARAVGYDAVAQYHYYIKSISGIRNWTHAWTEVIDDQGVAYVCDAEIRIEIVRQRGYGTAAFMEKKSTIGNYGPGYLTYYYAWGYN